MSERPGDYTVRPGGLIGEALAAAAIPTADRSLPCVYLFYDAALPDPWCLDSGRVPARDCASCPDWTPAQNLRTRCEIWTRVMGYHRPVSAFNSGKQSEHSDRRHMSEAAAAVSPYAGIAHDPGWEPCGDCPSLGLAEDAADAVCMRQTVPMGEGCLLHRVHAEPAA